MAFPFFHSSLGMGFHAFSPDFLTNLLPPGASGPDPEEKIVTSTPICLTLGSVGDKGGIEANSGGVYLSLTLGEGRD